MKSLTCFLLLFLLTGAGCSVQKIRIKKVSAVEIIGQLKEEGAIIVRLHTYEKKIEKLENSGQDKKANSVRMHQMVENEQLQEYFKLFFDFCPVYFVYMEEGTEQLRENGKIQEFFLDETGEVNPSIRMKESFFLLTDYSYYTVDSHVFSKYKSMVLYTPDFELMPPPFPLGASSGGPFSDIRDDLKSGVKALNFNLHHFYGKSSKWKRKDWYEKVSENQ